MTDHEATAKALLLRKLDWLMPIIRMIEVLIVVLVLGWTGLKIFEQMVRVIVENQVNKMVKDDAIKPGWWQK